MVNKPLANELLAELTLFLTLLEAFLIAVGIEIAGRVGGMYLVDKDYFAVAQTEFIFSVDRIRPFSAAIFDPRAKSLRV